MIGSKPIGPVALTNDYYKTRVSRDATATHQSTSMYDRPGAMAIKIDWNKARPLLGLAYRSRLGPISLAAARYDVYRVCDIKAGE